MRILLRTLIFALVFFFSVFISLSEYIKVVSVDINNPHSLQIPKDFDKVSIYFLKSKKEINIFTNPKVSINFYSENGYLSNEEILVEIFDKNGEILKEILNFKNPCYTTEAWLKSVDISSLISTNILSAMWYILAMRDKIPPSLVFYLLDTAKSKDLTLYSKILTTLLLFDKKDKEELLRWCEYIDLDKLARSINVLPEKEAKIIIVPDGFDGIINAKIRVRFDGKEILYKDVQNLTSGDRIILNFSLGSRLGRIDIEVVFYEKVKFKTSVVEVPKNIKSATMYLYFGDSLVRSITQIVGSNEFVSSLNFDGGISRDLKIGVNSDPYFTYNSLYLLISCGVDLRDNLKPVLEYLRNNFAKEKVKKYVTVEDYIIYKTILEKYNEIRNTGKTLEAILYEKFSETTFDLIKYISILLNSIYKGESLEMNEEYIETSLKLLDEKGSLFSDIRLTSMLLYVIKSYGLFCIRAFPIILTDSRVRIEIGNNGFHTKKVVLEGCGIRASLDIPPGETKVIDRVVNYKKSCEILVKDVDLGKYFKIYYIPKGYTVKSFLKNLNINVIITALAIIAFLLSLYLYNKVREIEEKKFEEESW